MCFLTLIPLCWIEREPPGLCHTGIEELFALGAAGAAEGAGAATAATAGAAAATAAETSAFALPSLSSIGTAASIAGTGLSAIGALNQGAYQSDLAKVQAQALKDKANEDAAAGERAAITQERKATLVQSRARALAAGSGTLASDPTETNIEGQIAQQGDYNALSSLYEGLSRARTDTTQASIDLFKGQQAAAAAPLTAGGTILSGLSNLATNRAQLRLYTKTGTAPNTFGL